MQLDNLTTTASAADKNKIMALEKDLISAVRKSNPADIAKASSKLQSALMASIAHNNAHNKSSNTSNGKNFTSGPQTAAEVKAVVQALITSARKG